jgi:hypothetical protein
VLSVLQYVLHIHIHSDVHLVIPNPLLCKFYLFIYRNHLLNRRYVAADMILMSSLETCGYVVGLLHHLSVCFKTECQYSQHYFLTNLFLQKCKFLFYEHYG